MPPKLKEWILGAVCSALLISMSGCSDSATDRKYKMSPELKQQVTTSFQKINSNEYDGIAFESDKASAKTSLSRKYPNLEEHEFNLMHSSPGGRCALLTNMTFYKETAFKTVNISPTCDKGIDMVEVSELVKKLQNIALKKYGKPWLNRSKAGLAGQYQVWKTRNFYLIIAFSPKRYFGKHVMPLDISLYSKKGMPDHMMETEIRYEFGF